MAEHNGLDEVFERVAKGLPPDLQRNLLDNLQKWKANENKSLSILVTGRTGAGKSTLVNGILGIRRDDQNDTEEGQSAGVKSYRVIKNGVKVTVWDSPGIQDEYLEQMKRNCSNVGLMMYCISMRETTFFQRSDNPDVVAMRKVTKAFGNEFWQKAVIVLTYANVLEAFNPHWEDLSDEGKEKAFNDKIKEWDDQIKGILSKDIGVPNKIVDNLRIAPTGHERKPHLLGVEYWLSNLWFHCFDSVTSPDTRCAMLQVNLERLKRVALVKKEDFEDQPTVITDNTMRNVVVGGVSGGVNGGVIGGIVGGVVGGPIGAVVGAGIGAFLGGGGGGGIGKALS